MTRMTDNDTGLNLTVSGRSVYNAVRNLVVHEFKITPTSIFEAASDRIDAAIARMNITTPEIASRINRTALDIANKVVAQEARAVMTTMTTKIHEAIDSEARKLLASEWAAKIVESTIDRVVAKLLADVVKKEVTEAIGKRLHITVAPVPR